MTEISDRVWSYLRGKAAEGIVNFEDLLNGLGKLTMQSSLDAGMTIDEAEAIATLHDLLVGATEIQTDSER